MIASHLARIMRCRCFASCKLLSLFCSEVIVYLAGGIERLCMLGAMLPPRKKDRFVPRPATAIPTFCFVGGLCALRCSVLFDTHPLLYMQVPMSLVYRKDTYPDGLAGKKAPCMLYGYGSYGASIEPSFDFTR